MNSDICRRIGSILLLVIFSAQGIYGQAKDTSVVEIPRTEDTISIDGILDEPAWAEASKLEIAYEWFPADGEPPPVNTTCLVIYSRSHLYFGFIAEDPDPEAIRAHLMDRDDILPFIQDDHVGLLLDTFNDERRAVQLRVNPLGVQADAIFSELEGFEDFSWDMIWDSAGRINNTGYSVEIAVPFNQLRFPETDEGQIWGIQASRSYPRSVRHRMASHLFDRDRSCILCQINKVFGFEGISPGKNIEVSPTLTAIRSDARSGDRFENGTIGLEPGISGRWGVTSDMVLNLAINPDFSQVEADAAQLDVNNRFALFFEEKRPFFLEGADFFLTPIQAVFTRSVSDPLFGIKVTGKSEGHAVGGILTRDRVNALVLANNQFSRNELVDDEVNGAVVRYRRDLGRGSTIGGLFTGRKSTGYENGVGGFDSFLRLSNTNTLQVQVLASQSVLSDSLIAGQDEQQGRKNDLAGKIQFTHSSERWQVMAGYEDFGASFRADYGFLPRVDFRQGSLNVQRVYRGDAQNWYSQLRIGVSLDRTGDHSGRLTDENVGINALFLGRLQSVVNLSIDRSGEFFSDRYYTLNSIQLFSSFQPSGKSTFGFTGRIGDQIDILNRDQATELLIIPSISLKMGRALRIAMSNTSQRLGRENGRILLANIFQSTFRYNLSLKSFVRWVLQYQTVKRNLENYTPEVREGLDSLSKQLFSQVLFSYKINPQTVLFLGYSDGYSNQSSDALLQTGRTFFFKLGYAFVG